MASSSVKAFLIGATGISIAVPTATEFAEASKLTLDDEVVVVAFEDFLTVVFVIEVAGRERR